MEEIILYTTDCAKCNVIETKLKQQDLVYIVIKDVDVMLDKGFLSAPMLDVDGQVMNFTQANNWLNERG